MAHIPLIHGPDGAKLSKRHGALGVDAYRTLGYLPAALRNYLVRLGWSHGDQEIFSTDEMIDAFSLDQVGRSPARFDFAKLENLNGHYIRGVLRRGARGGARDHPARARPGARPRRELRARSCATSSVRAMPGLKERAKTLVELLDSAAYLYARRPLALDDKAAQLVANGGRERIAGVVPHLAALADWTRGKRPKKRCAASPRRAASSSGRWRSRCAPRSPAAPPRRRLFDVMAVLGRDESLGRPARPGGRRHRLGAHGPRLSARLNAVHQYATEPLSSDAAERSNRAAILHRSQRRDRRLRASDRATKG